MLTTLCEAGLSNFSRPSVVNANRLGCEILGPRRRVSGVLIAGFEVANLLGSDLPPPPKGSGLNGGTWWTCNQVKGCDKKLDWQLAQPVPGVCDTGLATVVAYGWVTETPGEYGHLGVYAREFFVDEVERVEPPPPAIAEKMRQMWVKSGVRDCR